MGPELGALFEKEPRFQWERGKFLKVYMVLPPKLDVSQVYAIYQVKEKVEYYIIVKLY